MERSFSVCRVAAAGSSLSKLGSIAFTRSTTSTVLASGWRWTASMMARLPLYQLAVWLFSTELMTGATSPRRTGWPLRIATMMLAELRRRWRAACRPGWSALASGFCSVPTGVFGVGRRDRRLRPRRRRCRARQARPGRAGRARRISGCRRSAPGRRRRCVESAGEITCCANASSLESGIVSLCSASSRIGASAGLTLR